MAEVGVALLSAVLPMLFDRMASREVLECFREQKLSEGLIRKLKIALQSVNAALADAEEKQVTDPAVKEWLEELHDAVYDAEDILAEIDTEALERKLDAAGKPQNSTSAPPNTFVRDIESKITEVIDKIEDLAKQKDDIGLREVSGGRPSERLPTTSLVQESDIYGRQDDRDAITKLLVSDHASGGEMCVIGIVGMGGIGKTALAQLVYNDAKVEKHFDLKAWVYVSEEFDAFKLTKKILEAVTPKALDIEDLNLLQNKLKQELMGKKFLLVLDDVWNESYTCWEQLNNPLRSAKQESRIIVTTRSENVAFSMRTVAAHHLKELPDKDCWSLFAKHAFPSHNSNVYPRLEVKGKEIMRKCKGLPLAVKTIGALLWSKRDVDEWDKILKSNLWDLQNDGRNILPALRLSYKYLPSRLKRCFAYCSIFPKDYVFDKDQLVLLWMAEGFLQEAGNKTMEEVGNEYFHDLVSRSLFQQSNGNDPSFVMHDLVNDLARFVSGQLSFRLEGDYSEKIKTKTRHLSFLITKFDSLKEFGAYEAKQLRTFLSWVSSSREVNLTERVPHDLLVKLSRLRVLSLSHLGIVNELPNSIGKIKHLHYLDLSSTTISRLPDSICTLCNLQTLKLSRCQYLSTLPIDMRKLHKLRHLDLSFTIFRELPESIGKFRNLQTLKLSGCRNLAKFPGDMRELTGLRHLDLSFTTFRSLPDFIFKLCNLQTLNLSGCRDLAELPEDMQKLTDLRHLDLSFTTFRRLPYFIFELRNLRTMNLSCCRNLAKLPEDMQKLTNLLHLDLSFTTFESLPDFLHKLPNLEVLKLSYCRHLTLSSRDIQELSSLRHLDITGIKEMPTRSGGGEHLTSSTTFSFEMKTGSCIGKLGTDSNLQGRVSILELQNVELLDDAQKANLKDKESIEELVLEWNDLYTQISKNQIHVLGDLQPHSNLKSLIIKHYRGESFPCWVGNDSFSNIASLHLINCTYCYSLPSLGQLPSLNELFIAGFDGVARVGPEFYGSGASSIRPFGALKVLRFEHMVKWIEWSSFDAKNTGVAFPFLRELYIEDCPILRAGLPEHLRSLVKLVIKKCPQLVQLPKLIPAKSELELIRCNEVLLKTLPTKMQKLVVKGFDALESIPDGMIDSSSGLEYFGIGDCSSLVSLPNNGLPSTLKVLEIAFCEKLNLPMDLPYRSLEKLLLTHSCDPLKSFQLESFPKLYEIKIHGCRSLESLKVPKQHEDDLVTWQIEICNCPNFVSFPEDGLHASKLTRFTIVNCRSLRLLPSNMNKLLPSLEYLTIEGCPEVEPFSEGDFGELGARLPPFSRFR